jgi:hypothetical protein
MCINCGKYVHKFLLEEKVGDFIGAWKRDEDEVGRG